MECEDEVLFMLMDTGMAGCLIVIPNSEEKLYYGDQISREVMLKQADNLLHGKNLLRTKLPEVSHTRHGTLDIEYGRGIITQLRVEETRDIRDEYNQWTGEFKAYCCGVQKQTCLTIRALQDRYYEIEADIQKIEVRQRVRAPYDSRTCSTTARDTRTYYFDQYGCTTQIERRYEK